MGDLIKLVRFLYDMFELKTKNWVELNSVNPYNGNKNVCHIINDSNILNYIYSYRDYLNTMNDLHIELQKLNLSCKISTRVKDNNSIQDKLHRYMGEKHNYGEIPIKKCLNDIFGFRIVFNEDYTHDKLIDLLKDKFDNIKVINADNNDYRATHAYFKMGDNKSFQWELQMWNKSDEKSNLESHQKYKQEYTKWENERKESE